MFNEAWMWMMMSPTCNKKDLSCGRVHTHFLPPSREDELPNKAPPPTQKAPDWRWPSCDTARHLYFLRKPPYFWMQTLGWSWGQLKFHSGIKCYLRASTSYVCLVTCPRITLHLTMYKGDSMITQEVDFILFHKWLYKEERRRERWRASAHWVPAFSFKTNFGSGMMPLSVTTALEIITGLRPAFPHSKF